MNNLQKGIAIKSKIREKSSRENTHTHMRWKGGRVKDAGKMQHKKNKNKERYRYEKEKEIISNVTKTRKKVKTPR